MSRWLLLFLIFCGATYGSDRHITLLVDTSGSMKKSDEARYTVQVSKILSDLLSDNDRLDVIRMPMSSDCGMAADAKLAKTLDSTNRQGFKQVVDGHIFYGGKNAFMAPIRTAKQRLEGSPEYRRMLLIVADSGGLACKKAGTNALMALKKEGVTIAAINLGSTTKDFERNPAFDFTIAAPDAMGLIKSIAEVYQHFLGGKKVQTGRASAIIEVDIGSLVKEAFLVVAADGPISEVSSDKGNPSALSVQENLHGGGSTVGLDDIQRTYRIVKLDQPDTGHWRFKVEGMNSTGGWMLVQDSALALRKVSGDQLPKGFPALVVMEVFDERTGKVVVDPKVLSRLSVTGQVQGVKVDFFDKGLNGDSRADDGVFTGLVQVQQAGNMELFVDLQNGVLTRNHRFSIQVIDANWILHPDVPSIALVGEKVVLKVHAQGSGRNDLLVAMDSIEASVDGQTHVLMDDGSGVDAISGDGLYTSEWRMGMIGEFDITFNAIGGSFALPVKHGLEVVGELKFGTPISIDFGKLAPSNIVVGTLDLSGAKVKGKYYLKVFGDIDPDGGVAEIQIGEEWFYLNSGNTEIVLSGDGVRKWNVRVRAGWCLPEQQFREALKLQLKGLGPYGEPVSTAVPVKLIVQPSTWWECWWFVVVLVAGLLLLLFIIYGFIWPKRFPRAAEIWMSDEEDINEGFAHPIHSIKGSGVGFYRHASLYIHPDFRLSREKAGAMVRMRAAHAQRIMIEPIDNVILRQSTDGEWLELDARELLFSRGVIYTNGNRELFFELRGGM